MRTYSGKALFPRMRASIRGNAVSCAGHTPRPPLPPPAAPPSSARPRARRNRRKARSACPPASHRNRSASLPASAARPRICCLIAASPALRDAHAASPHRPSIAGCARMPISSPCTRVPAYAPLHLLCRHAPPPPPPAPPACAFPPARAADPHTSRFTTHTSLLRHPAAHFCRPAPLARASSPAHFCLRRPPLHLGAGRGTGVARGACGPGEAPRVRAELTGVHAGARTCSKARGH